MVTIELYGVPRLRAGAREWTGPATTLGAALGALAAAFPSLAGTVITAEPFGPMPSYRVSLNGDRFVSDPETPLADGDALLLFAADVGG